MTTRPGLNCHTFVITYIIIEIGKSSALAMHSMYLESQYGLSGWDGKMVDKFMMTARICISLHGLPYVPWLPLGPTFVCCIDEID